MAIKYENSEKISEENVTINVPGAAPEPEPEPKPEPEIKRGTRWFPKFPPQRYLNVVLVILLIPVVILVITLLLSSKPTIRSEPIADAGEQQSGAPAFYSIDPNVNVTLPNKLYIIARREWLARPPEEEAAPLELPVPYVIIMHTAQENCLNHAECAFAVREAQSFHMDSRKWNDIGFSFLVGGDGSAYEGRGWKKVGAQVYGYNAKCIGIAFIGTFNNIVPPERQIVAAKQLIEFGVKEGYIAKNYKLLGARQLQTTQSPGLVLYEDIKKWPHWSPTP